jgi:hypothetical protein
VKSGGNRIMNKREEAMKKLEQMRAHEKRERKILEKTVRCCRNCPHDMYYSREYGVCICSEGFENHIDEEDYVCTPDRLSSEELKAMALKQKADYYSMRGI